MMKSLYFKFIFIVFLFVSLFPSISFAITNGMNASDLLGQYDQTSFTNPVVSYTKSGPNDGANIFGYNGPADVLLDSINNRFFVSDTINNRVLVYNLNNDNTFPDKFPDYVLGQVDFTGSSSANTQSGLNAPRGLAYDEANNILFVAEGNGHRVKVFDVSSITNGMNASYVLGQVDFTGSSSANTQSGLNVPQGLAYDGVNNILFVAEGGGNRVKVFDVSSITNGMNASYVLGQVDFTGFFSANTQSGLNVPRGLAYDGANNRLFVAEGGGHRVKVFDVSSITNGMNASYVLGQVDFTGSSSANTQSGLNDPLALAYDGANNRLFVAEGNGHRVKVFDVSSITNGMNASYVLGQVDFTRFFSANTQSGLNVPRGLAYDGANKILFVAEGAGHRVKVFDVSSITNGMNASDLLGQYDQTSFTNPVVSYTKSGPNDGANIFGYNGPADVLLDSINNRFFVSDTINNRVLVYNLNNDNTFPDKFPDYVLGQVDFTGSSSANTQSGLNVPQGLAYDGVNNILFVAEGGGNRVKVFDVSSITNGMNASYVLGQVDFTGFFSANTQSGLNDPLALAYDGVNNILFVAEGGGNRVKVFDVSSITNGMNASYVLGQVDFTGFFSANTQSGLNVPRGLAYDGANNRLFVAEGGGHRVKVFDVSSITNGMNASYVLGQVDFTGSSSANTQSGLNFPNGLAYDGANNRLFVAEGNGHRVKVFDVSSITNGMNASYVLGQVDFTGFFSANTQSGLNVPQGLAYDGANNRLFIAEWSGHRVKVFDVDTRVLSISSTNGQYTLNNTVSITVTFSSNVTVTGFPKLTLETGTTDRDAVYVSGSGTNSLVFEYTVQTGDSNADLDYTSSSSLYLDGGTIKNSYNNENAILTLPNPSAIGSLSYNNDIVIVSDITPPTLNEVTPVPTPTNDTTPNYTFNTDEEGTISYGGSCSSSTTVATVGSNTITFNTLTDNTYSNCTITVTDTAGNASSPLSVSTFVIDTTGPILTEVTPVSVVVNNNPINYTFNTNEAGNITYGGSCSSYTTVATTGNNTITFNPLSPGNYSNCTITVTDSLDYISNILNISPFDIVVHSGGGSSPSIPLVVPPVVVEPIPILPVETIPSIPNNTENTNNNIPTNLNLCPSNQILTQNLKAGARDGRYNTYTRAIVKEVKILQTHMNRLGFNAGIVDGILGPITDGSIKRMQASLGTTPDGLVGPNTRRLINRSCEI